MYTITHYSADNKRTGYGPFATMSDAMQVFNKLENELSQQNEMVLLFSGPSLVMSSKYE